MGTADTKEKAASLIMILTAPYYAQPANSGYHPSNSSVNHLSADFGSMDLDNGMSANYPPLELRYHLYTTPLPHITNLPPNRKTIHSFFMSDNLREELQRKNEASIQYLDPAQDSALPAEVHVYHSLYPLDSPNQAKSTQAFGYPTSVYKAASSIDGKLYVLRRIEGYRLTNEAAMSTIENWRKISHPNIVSVREAFTTKAFGDHSLVFVYDYHPCSTTLADQYLHPNAILPSARNSLSADNITEVKFWSFVVQITSALRTLHAGGLAACILDPTKILITGKNRIRLNCCGIYDMLSYASTRNTAHYQQEDLLQFGQLLTCLACNSSSALANLPKSIDFIARHYSPDVKNLILYLLSKPSTTKNIDDIIGMLGPKMLLELNRTHYYNDFLENELSTELENGRIARLMMKLGFINERPEFDLDPSWSETGDRYLIKLFRDYVFHQVDENGNPVLDIAHVLSCLNKLDAGLEEKIMLMSRDEQSCLIVSYKELKDCVQQAFSDLTRRH
ncbi:hypothetical protein K493DRAFT_331279 [Basidiobolus meristosporus CBS 931.73]|uniref:PAN2-PAN3 deadenylation complex subunit PAN3 n=1 Tax=Basidiobolus meristosporus CBS 931.73 TaxID=1314790 RepID=A0A1Y1XTC9_9FUNG|nr:hypothetical protein K493DRAFT_331279 [Basidiobolus meristosporus CBS 931.73]|eukprot:ORX88988.1 hypothetical protein K493DRAFT_331279 [Basidiobolus meristosporus CBS 931.73]